MKIPFHQHDFSSSEIQAVSRVLKGKWITGGPENLALEKTLTAFMGAQEAVNVSSATAGLFLSLKLFGIKPGDEVITSPYSFVATANVIRECGATPVFADIGPDYNIDPEAVSRAVTRHTKAIIAVDYGGYPCDYSALRQLPIPFHPHHPFQEALGRPLLLADSAHAIGTVFRTGKRGSTLRKQYADIHCYSFHAVKNITCGEGGVVTVMDISLAKAGMGKRLRQGRLHGINRDAYQREKERNFFYDMEERGYKCNLSEIAAALALSQWKRISTFKKKKEALKEFYDSCFSRFPGVKLRPENPLWVNWEIHPHLYTLEWDGLTPLPRDTELSAKEKFLRAALKKGVSLNFHYLPIPLLSDYLRRGYSLARLPVTRGLYPRHISLPFYSKLTRSQATRVVSVLTSLMQKK